MTDLTPPTEPPSDPTSPQSTSPQSTSPDGPARSRRTLVLALLALAALLAVGVFLVMSGDDDDDDDGGSGLSGDLPTLPSVPTPVTGDVSAEAEELLALLDRGEAGRYHATYVVEGDGSVIGGDVTLELWRDGERTRRDTRIVTTDSTADTVGIVGSDDAAIACSRVDEGEWTCTETAAPEEVEGDLLGSVRGQLTGAQVTPRDDEIDGREVRCFEFSTQDGPAEVCVTEEGVVVRLGSAASALRLTTLDEDVPGDVFTPPAEPTAPDEG